LAFLPLIDIPNDNYLRSYTVIFHHPDGVTITPVFSPSLGNPLSLTIDRGDRETIFVIDSLESVPNRPYYPFDRLQACLSFEVTLNGVRLNPAQPADFFAWYHGQMDSIPPLDSTARTVLGPRLDSMGTDSAKLELIHDWVRTNINYIADRTAHHEIIPHSPSYVLERRFGDCKDRACLVSSMAKSFGLSVHMVLVSTFFLPDFGAIVPEQFNHVICAFDHDSTTTFFDPTDRYKPFAVLSDKLIDHPALVLDKAKPRLQTLIVQDTTPTLEVAIVGRLDSLASAQARILIRGDLLSLVRYAEAEQTNIPHEKILEEVLNRSLIRLRLSDFKIVEETAQTMKLTARADLSQFAVVSTTHAYLPRTPLVCVSNEILKRDQDSLMVYLDSLVNVKLTLDLDPRGMIGAADSVHLSTPGGVRYEASMSPQPDGRIVAAYRLRLLHKLFVDQAKEDFLGFVRKYLSLKATMFALQGSGK
jgi:hypothetical protein